MKLVGRQTDGKEVLVDPEGLGGANVVLRDVPCEVSVYINAVVRMLGTGIARNAIATSLADSNILGIVESKPTTTTCDVRVLGVSDSLFTGLDVTKEYFLSATVAGGMESFIPASTGNIIVKIGQPYSTTELLVTKGQRVERL